MIEFKEVTKAINSKNETVKILNNLSFKVDQGCFFGIVGMSGSGKSTLLRCLSGITALTSGEILIHGKNLAEMNHQQKIHYQQTMATIFQGYNLLSHLTVAQNVALPLKLRKRQDDQRVYDVLCEVGLEHKQNEYPKTLSGGEKQRVAIARALVDQPDILLCDEPTSALDERTTQEVINILRRIKETTNTTVILVSHELNVIKQLCDEAIVLDQGNIVERLSVHRSQINHNQTYTERAREYLES